MINLWAIQVPTLSIFQHPCETMEKHKQELIAMSWRNLREEEVEMVLLEIGAEQGSKANNGSFPLEIVDGVWRTSPFIFLTWNCFTDSYHPLNFKSLNLLWKKNPKLCLRNLLPSKLKIEGQTGLPKFLLRVGRLSKQPRISWVQPDKTNTSGFNLTVKFTFLFISYYISILM